MSKVIKYVKPKVRDWTSSYGPMKSIDGAFEDGDEFTYNCKPGNEERIIAELESLVGNPLEGYSVEPAMDKNSGRQREYNGRLQWSLKKQQQGGFGGGGFKGGGGVKWQESYAQSRECKETEQRSIQRAVALDHASKTSTDPNVVLTVADRYFAWLNEGKPLEPKTPIVHQNGSLPENPGEVRPSTSFVKWEAEAFTFVAKHKDIWPTFQDALEYLKPQLLNMGLGSKRALKECVSEAKFNTLLGALKNRVKQPAQQPVAAGRVDDDLPF